MSIIIMIVCHHTILFGLDKDMKDLAPYSIAQKLHHGEEKTKLPTAKCDTY